MHSNPSPLLALPLELQNIIYELVIARPRVFVMHTGTNPTAANGKPQGSLDRFTYVSCAYERDDQHPILTRLYLVCRHLYRQTLVLFYSAPIFDFHDSFTMIKWTESLNDTQKASLRSMVLRDSCCNFLSADNSRFPGLQTIFATDPVDYLNFQQELTWFDVEVTLLKYS